jgi:hypothetical protein
MCSWDDNIKAHLTRTSIVDVNSVCLPRDRKDCLRVVDVVMVVHFLYNTRNFLTS